MLPSLRLIAMVLAAAPLLLAGAVVRPLLLVAALYLLLLLVCVFADAGQHSRCQLIHGTAAAEGVVCPLQHNQRVALCGRLNHAAGTAAQSPELSLTAVRMSKPL